jgi:hypothetical protein
LYRYTQEARVEQLFAGILENYQALDERFPGWRNEEYFEEERWDLWQYHDTPDHDPQSDKPILFEWSRSAWWGLYKLMSLHPQLESTAWFQPLSA